MHIQRDQFNPWSSLEEFVKVTEKLSGHDVESRKFCGVWCQPSLKLSTVECMNLILDYFSAPLVFFHILPLFENCVPALSHFS